MDRAALVVETDYAALAVGVILGCAVGKLNKARYGHLFIDVQLHIEADKLTRQLGQTVKIALRISDLDSDVLALDIAQLSQRC